LGWKALAASAAAFVVLALLAWWLLGRPGTAPPGAFFALKQRLPDTLTVMVGSDTTTIVPSGEKGWEVVRPVRYPADAVLVNAIIRELSDLKVDRRFPLTAEKMDTYGMRFPQGVLRASYRDGKAPDTLVIGSFTFDDTHDYVRNGSRPEVGLFPARIVRGFLLKATVDLRDTQLLPFLENRVTAFALYNQEGDTTAALLRQSDKTWNVSRPYPGPASDKKVREYLESLSHMHVDKFVQEGDGPLEPYGLSRPVAGARVHLEGGSVLGLDLGNPVPGTDLVYAHTLARPHVFGVSGKYLPVVRWGPDQFRRTAVVDFGLKQVSRVDIQDGGRSWSLALGDSLPREIRDVLGNWILLEATGFEPATPAHLQEAGLVASPRSLTWNGPAGVLARVELGDPAGDMVPLHVPEGLRARPGEILYAPRKTVEPLFQYLVDHAPGTP
jgi:uncharacterized protein DUF4340